MSAYGCKRENIAEAIAFLSRNGQHAHVVLFQALYAGEIGLAVVSNPTVPLGKIPLGRGSPPTLVLIGDDGDAPCGAERWRCARGVIAWAGAVVVHAAGAEPEQYRAAVELTKLTGRGVLIETTSAHAKSWIDIVPFGKPGFIVWPRGGVHPIVPERSGLH